MKRRDFLATAAAGAGAAFLTDSVVRPSLAHGIEPASPTPQTAADPFRCDFAPHFGMFRNSAGDDLVAQLHFMADRGFRSLEDNGMKGRTVAEQERIAREEFLSEIRESVEVARRVNATWMTVVPGHVDLRLHPDYQTANVVESLRQASAILEPHGLVMVLEPLNPRDHPGLFLTGMPQAYQICRAVDSPACKILDDLYHQQITEGNLIPNIDAAWDEIAYFQIGDNPGRREPTTGEINYGNVFQHIWDKGFRGILGMEHGNARPGEDGERAVIDAYRSVDATTG
jgi:hydroxypyruvate isomerase